MSSAARQPEPVETAAERLARELQLIAQAENEADAGLLIPQAEVNVWIDTLGTNQPLPMPRPSPAQRPRG